jgi:hypothetical protein
MSAKDDKRQNEDLKARLAALKSKPPPASDELPKPPPPATNLGDPRPKAVSDRRTKKETVKTLCHYMYVSDEEDLYFKRLIGRFITVTGEMIPASEALRVMMFAASDAPDEQIISAYERAKKGDGKRMK